METRSGQDKQSLQQELTAGPGQAHTAIILLNMGTPESPDTGAVRAYLTEFLSDPRVIRLPKRLTWGTPLLARLIALLRAKKSATNYAQIWTAQGSPLLAICRDQAQALQDRLGPEFQVELAMRYGQPSLDSVFDRLENTGIQQILFLPMYPHFAGATTGTGLARVYQVLQQRGLRYPTHVVSSWHDFPPYWEAQAHHIQEYIRHNHLTPAETILLFSAHSLPVSYIQSGDPYEKEVTASIQGISARLNWPEDHILTSYQSRLGPVEWLGPSTVSVLRQLPARGVTQVIVCPVSFTTDCLESLYEIGIEYRHLFEHELGGKLWLMPALNTEPVFIEALKSLVLRTLGGPLSC